MFVLGSHNAWSYNKVAKWWMKPIAFCARCQNIDLLKQYNEGSRCFDMRIRWDSNNKLIVAHGIVEYQVTKESLLNDLQMLNDLGGVSIRVIHEVRNKKQYEASKKENFTSFCNYIVEAFKDIKFWCGSNLYNREIDYHFEYSPSCEEKYSSVCPPRIIDDWFPWLYARLNNHKNLEKGTDCDIFLIDFVNIK